MIPFYKNHRESGGDITWLTWHHSNTLYNVLPLLQNKLLMDFLWTCYGSLEGFSYGLLMQLRLSKKSYPLLGGPTQLDNQTCIGKSVDFQPSNLVHGKLAFFFDLQPFGVGEATWKRRLAKRSLESFEAARGLALLRFFWPRKNGCPEVFRWRGWDERPSWWSTWTRLFFWGGECNPTWFLREIYWK